MDYSFEVENFMKIVNEFDKLKEKNALSIPDKGYMAVMGRLYQNKEMYSCQLAKELNLSRARLSLIVKNLKGKKYVTTHIDLTDKRINLIRITKEGSRIVKETYEKSMLKLKTLFEHLGKEKTNQLLEILGDISQIYKEDKEGELLCLD